MKKYFNLFIILLILLNNFCVLAKSKNEGFTKIECKLIPIPRLSSLISTNKESKLSTSDYRPHNPLTFGTSTNWSGYVSATNLNSPASNSVTKTHGSWIVPKLSPSNDRTFCAFWIGIDGYRSGTVEQIGTEHNWVNGNQINYAWFEMYPQSSFVISGFPVRIGDVISANVAYKGNNVFRLSIKNQTRNVSTVIPMNFTTASGTQRNSAEWVVEAPFLNNILPLANFGTAQFNRCWCIINNIKGAIANAHWQNDKIRMIRNNGTPKAIPTNLLNKNSTSKFDVIWKHQ